MQRSECKLGWVSSVSQRAAERLSAQKAPGRCVPRIWKVANQSPADPTEALSVPVLRSWSSPGIWEMWVHPVVVGGTPFPEVCLSFPSACLKSMEEGADTNVNDTFGIRFAGRLLLTPSSPDPHPPLAFSAHFNVCVSRGEAASAGEPSPAALVPATGGRW